MPGGSSVGSVEPPAKARWRPTPFGLLIVALLVASGWAASSWWASGCHDGYCTGSKHRVTLTVAADLPGACLENVGSIRTGDRTWYSGGHAPAEWGAGTGVAGTLVVTSTHEPRYPPTGGGRRATFTADQGGSVTFTGGTADSFSQLPCSVR